ncbi:MAG: beta-ketoacyl synthase N-terminal-like domain-containing protein [Vicinamibacterales bacterium]|nr:beta-ketoacyl synthase N-terminal-like domain-containing protein [Vicinamibacterales bacterium]
MPFPPIAIVGRSCLLPGAPSPQALWDRVVAGTDLLTECPDDRWRLPARFITADPAGAGTRISSRRGGYVEGFDAQFDPTGFHVPADLVAGLDPAFRWVLHTGRAALADAGYDAVPSGARTGAIMGNLCYPSEYQVRFAEAYWLDAQREAWAPLDPRVAAGVDRPAAENRFSSGLPAHMLARALGLDAGAYALDAACASSLYALKLACGWLHTGRADIMLAGAVNRCDDLFIHAGFSALQALSPSGRSRPFHREADGLVPAEGAAFVVLKRLDDAVRDGDRILGVIRGIGLSNDGRAQGLLVPSEQGQVRAMERAYEIAGLAPADISLVECHATGTVVGDATEVRSMSRVYAGQAGVPLGSLKSNLGHAITVAGLGGLLKVLGAIEHATRPPTLWADQPVDALAGSPFRLLAEAEPWPSDGPRRAAVSAFGFGGNNAHLLVEEWQPSRPLVAVHSPAPGRGPVAIVGVGARVGAGQSRDDFADAIFAGAAPVRDASGAPAGTVTLPLTGLRFPPRDLADTLPQQLLVMRAAAEAIADVAVLPAARTGAFVGMGCDNEIARMGVRERLAGWVEQWTANGVPAGGVLTPATQDAIAPRLNAAMVVGMMPNIVTNRINSQFDLTGQSFSVAAEEVSGLVALDEAIGALRAGEIDAAVVGAVDLSCEPVHQAAAREVLAADRQVPGDAAVALVLKRLEDAERDGDRVYAILPDEEPEGADLRLGFDEGATSLVPVVGHAHAASGLVHVAAGALALHHRLRPVARGGVVTPWLADTERRAVTVAMDATGGQRAVVHLVEAAAPPAPLARPIVPRVHAYAGADRRAVIAAAERDDRASEGPACLVVVAADETERARKAQAAVAVITAAGDGAVPFQIEDGLYFRDRPIGGEVGFIFGGAGGSYRGMARDVIAAFPSLLSSTTALMHRNRTVAGWIFEADGPEEISPAERLKGGSFVSYLHAAFSRDILGLKPDAAIGLSSGETTALFALGAWGDLDIFYDAFLGTGAFDHEIAGNFKAIARAWGSTEAEAATWQTWRVVAPIAAVRKALEGETRAHITIVHTNADLIVAGEAAACARVVAKLEGARAFPVRYNVAVHCPELKAFGETWHAVHRRPTRPVPGVRFYTHATNSHFALGDDAVADMLTQQAVQTIEFPKVIEAAWNDGVRVFIEHGPRAGCAAFAREILGDREHLAVALDTASEPSLIQAVRAAAQLIAAGVPVDRARLGRALDDVARWAEAPRGPVTVLPAHPAPVRLPAPRTAAVSAQVSASGESRQAMAMAPALPSVFATLAEPVRALAPAPVFEMVGAAAGPVSSASEMEADVSEWQRNLRDQYMTMVARVAHAQQSYMQHAAAAFARAGQTPGFGAPEGPFARAGQTGYDATPAAFARAGQAGVVDATRPVVQAAPSTVHRAPVTEVAPPTVHRAPVTEVAPSTVHRAPVTDPAPSTVHRALSTTLPGPKFNRQELEVLSSGKISSLFGPLFEQQDQWRRQVRMPEPPLLLADRVTGIDAEPGVHGTGTIWTETDVTPDAWYLNDGRMPAGIMIEAGQADLLLISWMGADFLNKGERVYRLLGCELTYHGGLPRVGDTLKYDIHVDGHASQGDVRLFFFHYDCRVNDEVRLSVRQGQAGFFSDRDLAESGGVLWDINTATPLPDCPVAPPAVPCTRTHFGPRELEAFAAGRPFDCFGPGFEHAETHVRSPRIQGGQMLLLSEVTHFDPTGGPWGRGYCRAETRISPDDWFFQGHFKNDPCMPGTLMFEGCLELMAFYLTGLGYTLEKDGWQFEPVPEEKYLLRCRGQVLPTSPDVVCELFVEEVTDGPYPTIYADLLGTVDGLKAFHCRRMGLRLVPDWPLSTREDQVIPDRPGRPVAEVDGFQFGSRSLLACAWGKPSEAFGQAFTRFDGTRRLPRLPGPPYLFMSRVTKVEGAYGVFEKGAAVDLEFDVSPTAWYFDANGAKTMPYAVLLEAALQPCGWLTAYSGAPLASETDLAFRNLEGTATQLVEILPDSGTLRTHTRCTAVATMPGMFLESFKGTCYLDDVPVYEFTTKFGHFSPEALSNQKGLPTTDADRVWVSASSDRLEDLTSRPARYCSGSLRLPDKRLLMIDRVTGIWPEAGAKGLGRLRAEKDVKPSEWFFKAHFFQDPVQPGSLGIEALIQLLQFHMLDRDMGAGMTAPRFEPIAIGRPMSWKYRGQVVPRNKTILTEIEITEVGRDDRGAYAVANGWLWVDGLRVYSVEDMAMRIVDGER